ncbi:HIRAN domain-containing protein [Staphylococcus pseudintermedius]|uniref:HIRAN domain-containing protein n=2 Tax=Staphylococcus pseudintermedius TaxID=283734 RepID=UPI0036F29F41
MKAKQRDKDSLLNKFPDFRIIIETTGSTNYQGTEYNGSIISSFKEIAFVCEKKNFIYVIPWSDINSISTKKTFITNNINLTYDNSSKNLTFKFTNVESVIAIEVLSQAINEHKMTLKVQEDLLNSKEKELKDLQLHKESEFQLTHHDIASIKPNNLEKYDLINDEAETTDNIVQDSFIVVGLNYENRHKKLKKMINSMKKNEEFFFLYEDLRGKELLDELEFGGVIFEIDNYEKVPGIYLEKEPNNMYDSNAIKVMVSNDYGSFNVGYVPSENAKYLNDYFNNIVSCTAYIYGGKYKEFDYIEERIVTKEKNYGLKLEISYYK